MSQVRFSNAGLPADLLDLLDAVEAKGAGEVAARADTYALTIYNSGKPLGYAVFGIDNGGILAVYYARSFVPGFGKMAMRSIFGAGQITGTPVRVHTEKVAAMARAMGADMSMIAKDADGVPMGVFA